MSAITGHWIDAEFQLHEALLGFRQLTGRHIGAKLAKETLNILNEFDLAKKLFCVTTDNASNNGKMVKVLKKELRKQGISWNGETNHISCLSHVLNLVVQAFLKTVKAIAPNLDDDVLNEEAEDTSDVDEEQDADDITQSESEANDEDDLYETGDNNGLQVDENDLGIEVVEGFQEILKKLRTIAKVQFVAYKASLLYYTGNDLYATQ